MTITNEIYDKWEASFLNLMDLLSVLSLWKSINFSLFVYEVTTFHVLSADMTADFFKNSKDFVLQRFVINFLGNPLKFKAFPSRVLSVCQGQTLHCLNYLRKFNVDLLMTCNFDSGFTKLSLNLSFIQLPLGFQCSSCFKVTMHLVSHLSSVIYSTFLQYKMTWDKV